MILDSTNYPSYNPIHGGSAPKNGVTPMPKFKLENEFLSAFPKSTSTSRGRPRTTTDWDIQVQALIDEGTTPSSVGHFIDYNVEDTETGQVEVEEATARQRASNRAQLLRGRGYGTDDGWVVRAIDGHVYAQYWGVGNVPDEFVRKTKKVEVDA